MCFNNDNNNNTNQYKDLLLRLYNRKKMRHNSQNIINFFKFFF
jgi:hypothetical protein